jgi:hypothetical protein
MLNRSYWSGASIVGIPWPWLETVAFLMKKPKYSLYAVFYVGSKDLDGN